MGDIQLPTSAAGWYEFAKRLGRSEPAEPRAGQTTRTITISTPPIDDQSGGINRNTVEQVEVDDKLRSYTETPSSEDASFASHQRRNQTDQISSTVHLPPTSAPREDHSYSPGTDDSYGAANMAHTLSEAESEYGSAITRHLFELNPKRVVIDSILVALVGSGSETIKLNMLVFLQEKCLQYFRDIKIMWCFFNTVKHVLEQPMRRGIVSSVLKGQLLVVATTILIEVEGIDDYCEVFNAFIILLASMIQRTNSYSDSYARQMACECLRELELSYPCLLSGFVEDILQHNDLFDPSTSLPSLFKLCHAERSHTSPSYTVLLLSILEHCTSKMYHEITIEAQEFVRKSSVSKEIPASIQKVGASSKEEHGKEAKTPVSNATSRSKSDSFTPTPSPGHFRRYGQSSAGKCFPKRLHARTLPSLPTPLTARLSRVPMPLLRSGIAEVLKELAKSFWPEPNLVNFPRFEVPESTIGFGVKWVQFGTHFPSSMLTNRNTCRAERPSTERDASSQDVPGASEHNTLASPTPGSIQRQALFNDFVVNKLISVFSFVLKDAWELMSPWSLCCMVAKVVPFAHMLDLDPSLFRHHFLGLAFTRNALLFHVALLLHSAIAGVFSERDELTLVHRLKVLMGDSSILVQTRLLSVHWMLGFPAQIQQGSEYRGFSSLFLLLHQHSKDLWPSVFDPLILREAKLQALLHCFDTTPFSKCAPPSNMIDALVCLGEYRYCGPFSRVSLAVYRFLYQVLRRFPSLCRDVQRVLHDTVALSPRFVNNTIHLIDLYMNKHYEIRRKAQTTFSGDETKTPTDKVSLFLFASFCPMLSTIEPARRLHHYFSLMERVVLEPHINPTPALTALLRYMRLTDVCYQGEWSTGAKILSICRSALLTHPTALVYEVLGNVLRFLSSYHGDVDTRDRAWLYLQLLTHVERPKLMAVIDDKNVSNKPAIDFEPKEQRSVKTLAIEVFLTLDRSVDKRKAIGLHDGGTADIAHMLWDKKMSNECFQLVAGPSKDSSLASIDLLIQYFSFLLEHKDEFEIHMPLQIRYRQRGDHGGDCPQISEQEPGLSIPSSGIEAQVVETKDPIYALVMEFSTSPDYVPIQSINLPYLKSPPVAQNSEDGASSAAFSRFPYMYKLVLTLKPIAPVPTSFDVRLVFNDVDGRMFEGRLQDVKVLFQDLFLPLPINLAFSNAIPKTGGDKDDYALPDGSRMLILRRMHSRIFEILWDAVLLPDMGFRGFSRFNEIGGGGAEAVKLLRMPRKKIMEALKCHLGPFIVPNFEMESVAKTGKEVDEEHIYDETDDLDAEETWYAMHEEKEEILRHKGEGVVFEISTMKRFIAVVLLPPKFHLLFKFHVSDTSTLVRIRTDRWQLLSELDNFFQRWYSHT